MPNDHPNMIIKKLLTICRLDTVIDVRPDEASAVEASARSLRKARNRVHKVPCSRSSLWSFGSEPHDQYPPVGLDHASRSRMGFTH